MIMLKQEQHLSTNPTKDDITITQYMVNAYDCYIRDNTKFNERLPVLNGYKVTELAHIALYAQKVDQHLIDYLKADLSIEQLNQCESKKMIYGDSARAFGYGRGNYWKITRSGNRVWVKPVKSPFANIENVRWSNNQASINASIHFAHIKGKLQIYHFKLWAACYITNSTRFNDIGIRNTSDARFSLIKTAAFLMIASEATMWAIDQVKQNIIKLHLERCSQELPTEN